MLSLNDRDWKEFWLVDIFSIKATSSSIDKIKLSRENGLFPYITRSYSNNGINDFVCQQEDYAIDSGNCITVGLDTQTAFYQEAAFYTGQNIQILRNPKLNKMNAKFFIPLLKKTLSVFSWGGNGATLTRLRRSKILLPITDEGALDYAFMEQYIHEREQRITQNYIDYVSNNIRIEGDITPLNQKEWREFRIEKLFNVKIGKSIDGNKVDRKNGYSAYITRKENNNGLDGFIDYGDKSYLNTKVPVITIGNETAEPYVQVFPFFTGTKVNILKPKIPLSKNTLLFIARSLKMHKVKYSYSFTINSTRLRKQTVLLPVRDDGKPDYAYMEQYVKYQLDTLKLRYLEEKANAI